MKGIHNLSYPNWQEACQKRVDKAGLFLEGLWADDDPYELLEASKEAYQKGMSPKDFIEDIFSEDLARLAHDAIQEQEALDYENSDEESDN